MLLRSAKSDMLPVSAAPRNVKFTAKGLAFHIEMSKKNRSLKCKQAEKYMEQMSVLMESTDDVNAVQYQLGQFIQCYEEANATHESFVNVNLPKSEVERQDNYFHAKMKTFCDFTEEAKKWLSDAGHPYVQTKEKVNEPLDNQGVVSDGINPEDSVSNISYPKGSHYKASSHVSKASSTTSSVRIQVESDKAALTERLTALTRKKQKNQNIELKLMMNIF